MDIVDKINLYSHTINEIHDMEILIEMALILEEDIMINEAFDVAMLKNMGKTILKSIGIDTHKTGDGLIQVAIKSGKNIAELIYHALKGVAGNKESIERVKEIANKEITKEQFLDFLLKLDMATLHLVSGPLHAIDAWTGWHVWAHIKTQAESSMEKAKKAIMDLADAAIAASNEIKSKLKSLMFNIARLFGIHDEVKEFIKAV